MLALVVALVAAGLAALLHVWIFVMESVLWTTPRVRATFGITDAQAEHTRGMAFNQGFYNLFLAVVTAVGIVLVVAAGTRVDSSSAGVALVLAGVGSMFAAALVLLLGDRGKSRAALVQGAFPLVSLVALIGFSLT
ncbi:putative membrane protein [Microlunatus sagamiharensis]|uniref:Putative membrane protein n=1 Tax=Microlunatus sagamiharensis TaxID=546874 RepID=A0A1H2LYV9_9ACTN|nr:DUF1304 domain-containing protein [Microlunatus sagamiharensis]SDU86193.1 putative membrane protein [Microlunatus sagamiharensis]